MLENIQCIIPDNMKRIFQDGLPFEKFLDKTTPDIKIPIFDI